MVFQQLARSRRYMAPLLLACLTSCYTYASASVVPRLGDHVQLFLNDRGRAELRNAVGANTRSLTGRVTAAADSGVTLAVQESQSVTGVLSEWNGEGVRVPLVLLDSTRSQHFSVTRTALAAGAGAAVVALLQVAFSKVANGGSSRKPPPQPQ
jgi:hypothetical protein